MARATDKLRVFHRNPKVEEAPLAGELMLFEPATARFFVLNRTMTFVWRHCDGEHTLPGMAQEMASQFGGVEASAAEADVEKAVEELASLGLLVDLP